MGLDPQAQNGFCGATLPAALPPNVNLFGEGNLEFGEEEIFFR